MAAPDLLHPHLSTRSGFERAIRLLELDELGTVSDSLAALAHAADRVNDPDFVAECDTRYLLTCDEMERRPAFRREVARIAADMVARRGR